MRTISARAVDRVGDVRAVLGEGPVWSPGEGALWWTDITAGVLHGLSPGNGAARRFAFGAPLGCLAPRAEGGLVLGLGRRWHGFDPAARTLAPWGDADVVPDGQRFNDGATDPHGRFWAGTMPVAGAGPDAEGRLLCLDTDRTTRDLGMTLRVPNGLAFAPDGRTMYLSDSHPDVRTIWAFDYDAASGVPSRRRLFFDTRRTQGRPDGAAMDVDGCYWMAGVGGGEILRLTPQGKIDCRIEMPVRRPTKVAFGGAHLDILYVTSMRAQNDPDPLDLAGRLFAVSPGVSGHLPAPFGR